MAVPVVVPVDVRVRVLQLRMHVLVDVLAPGIEPCVVRVDVVAIEVVVPMRVPHGGVDMRMGVAVQGHGDRPHQA